MIDKLAALAYFAGWRIVRVLPHKWAYGLFEKLANYLVKRDGKGVARLRSNLSRIKPGLSEADMDALLRQAMSSYLRYWCDTFRIQDWSASQIQESVTLTRG